MPDMQGNPYAINLNISKGGIFFAEQLILVEIFGRGVACAVPRFLRVKAATAFSAS